MLVSARLGEAGVRRCGTAVVNGQRGLRARHVVRAGRPAQRLRGPVAEHPFTIDSLLTPRRPAPTSTPASPRARRPDRDANSQLTYTGGGADEVLDTAGQPEPHARAA